jgi:hypothetical protein
VPRILSLAQLEFYHEFYSKYLRLLGSCLTSQLNKNMAARRMIMQNVLRVPRPVNIEPVQIVQSVLFVYTYLQIYPSIYDFCAIADRSNPLESLNEDEIFLRYRFRSATILFLCSLIENGLQHKTQRSSPLPPLLQVLLALRFYATGAFYQLVGDSLAISKSTAGRAVRGVTSLLCTLAQQYVRFPTAAEIPEIRSKFHGLAGNYV